MSTIPTISSRPRVSYTVVGGSKIDRTRKYFSLLTVLMLNRGGRFYRREFLHDIQNLKLGEIICVEGPQIPYDIEPLSRQFPAIRFLLLQGKASVGEKINLGMQEARSRLVLVIWSDMKIAASPAEIGETGNLCTVPLLKNHRSEIIPSIQIPAFLNGKLKLIPWEPLRDGMKTIVPFDYCGIYDKQKYDLIGGFDQAVSNPYWQKLDFGFRAYLWGENIRFHSQLAMSYSGQLQSEDTTADASYKLFYLRNLAVRFRGNMGVLPYSGLVMYMFRSDTGPIYSYKEYHEVRRWVEANRYRFKTDARSLVSSWQLPE